MRIHQLVRALALLAPWLLAAWLLVVGGCAELAAMAPSVTIDVVATERRGTAGEGWSWGVGARLQGSTDPITIGASRTPRADRPLALEPSSRCRIAAICAWEARARARAIVRAHALSREGRGP